MPTRSPLIVAALLSGLSLTGCLGALSARSHAAAGTFVGSPGVAVLHAPDGTPVEAATILIDSGPPMTSPHVSSPMPTEGREAILVDERQRIIAPVALRPGQRLIVTGRTPIYMVYDRDGRRLTTADGKNVGGALMISGQPRELDRRE